MTPPASAVSPTLISWADPEAWPGRSQPQQGALAGPLMGRIACEPAPQQGGMVLARGVRYPDPVPCNMVPGSTVPSIFSTSVQNRTDISIGRLRYYVTAVGTRAPKEFCGTTGAIAAACATKPGEHLPKLIPQTCGRRVCDTCWDTWALRAGARVRDVLNGYLTAKYGQPGDAEERDRKLPRHISFHPPDYVLEELITQVKGECSHEWQFPSKFLRAFRSLAQDVLASAGVTAAVIIPHEIRLRNEIRTDNRMETNRYRSVLKGKDWKFKVKYYPHIHAICFGNLENSREFHARTGWTYRNHSTKGPVIHPEGLVFYLLSHAPAVDGVRNVTYIGELSNRRLVRIGERVFRVPELCEQCVKEHPLDANRRVISYLNSDTLAFQNDGNREAIYRYGRGPPVIWGFRAITEREYFRVVRLGEYRILPSGSRWGRPRWVHGGLDKEALDWITLGGSDDPYQGFWVVDGIQVDRYDIDLDLLGISGAVLGDWFNGG